MLFEAIVVDIFMDDPIRIKFATELFGISVFIELAFRAVVFVLKPFKLVVAHRPARWI